MHGPPPLHHEDDEDILESGSQAWLVECQPRREASGSTVGIRGSESLGGCAAHFAQLAGLAGVCEVGVTSGPLA